MKDKDDTTSSLLGENISTKENVNGMLGVLHGSSKINSEIIRWMLEAIAQIRAERQRPTDDRIVSKLKLQHEVDKSLVLQQLDLACREGLILKIHHNGMFSYNDPNHLKKTRYRCLQVFCCVDTLYSLSRLPAKDMRLMRAHNSG